MKKDFTYLTHADNLLRISVYGEVGSKPCLLYVHGFKGFKDWGFVPYAGEFFEKKGFTFVAFNFSHNGVGEDLQTFSEPDKFARNTFSLELEEAKEMSHLLNHTDHFGRHLSGKLGMIGHSRGGGISILAAQASPAVSALVTWASVSTFERYDKKLRQTWREKGYMEVTNSRTGQVFKLHTSLLDDVEKHGKSSLNILNAARDMEKPWLILHGENDETVPYYEAETLNIYADDQRVEMRLVPEAGHTFGAKHPFDGSNPALEQLLQQSADFFQMQLK
jgi:pimeloyl-ACP methyl ester carboxylesterase